MRTTLPRKQFACSESRGTWNFLKESTTKCQCHVATGQFFPLSNNIEARDLLPCLEWLPGPFISRWKSRWTHRLDTESSAHQCQGGGGGHEDGLEAGETTVRGETYPLGMSSPFTTLPPTLPLTPTQKIAPCLCFYYPLLPSLPLPSPKPISKYKPRASLADHWWKQLCDTGLY